MTSRGIRISRYGLAIACAGLGIWALAKGDSVFGGLQLVFSLSWFLLALFGVGEKTTQISSDTSRRQE